MKNDRSTSLSWHTVSLCAVEHLLFIQRRTASTLQQSTRQLVVIWNNNKGNRHGTQLLCGLSTVSWYSPKETHNTHQKCARVLVINVGCLTTQRLSGDLMIFRTFHCVNCGANYSHTIAYKRTQRQVFEHIWILRTERALTRSVEAS